MGNVVYISKYDATKIHPGSSLSVMKHPQSLTRCRRLELTFPIRRTDTTLYVTSEGGALNMPLGGSPHPARSSGNP